MVDTPVLGTGILGYEGSSPSLGTSILHWDCEQ